MNQIPPCGWRGGGCQAFGPWEFIVEMGIALLVMALLVWALSWWLDRGRYDEGPSNHDPLPPLPPVRHYHFDDRHGDRISHED